MLPGENGGKAACRGSRSAADLCRPVLLRGMAEHRLRRNRRCGRGPVLSPARDSGSRPRCHARPPGQQQRVRMVCAPGVRPPVPVPGRDVSEEKEGAARTAGRGARRPPGEPDPSMARPLFLLSFLSAAPLPHLGSAGAADRGLESQPPTGNAPTGNAHGILNMAHTEVSAASAAGTQLISMVCGVCAGRRTAAEVGEWKYSLLGPIMR